MGISVFLSYPKPCFGRQQAFVDAVVQHLKDREFSPRTLGVTDYDMDAPLTAIRRLMLESNGLLYPRQRNVSWNGRWMRTYRSPGRWPWRTSRMCTVGMELPSGGFFRSASSALFSG